MTKNITDKDILLNEFLLNPSIVTKKDFSNKDIDNISILRIDRLSDEGIRSNIQDGGLVKIIEISHKIKSNENG